MCIDNRKAKRYLMYKQRLGSYFPSLPRLASVVAQRSPSSLLTLPFHVISRPYRCLVGCVAMLDPQVNRKIASFPEVQSVIDLINRLKLILTTYLLVSGTE